MNLSMLVSDGGIGHATSRISALVFLFQTSSTMLSFSWRGNHKDVKHQACLSVERLCRVLLVSSYLHTTICQPFSQQGLRMCTHVFLESVGTHMCAFVCGALLHMCLYICAWMCVLVHGQGHMCVYTSSPSTDLGR